VFPTGLSEDNPAREYEARTCSPSRKMMNGFVVVDCGTDAILLINEDFVSNGCQSVTHLTFCKQSVREEGTPTCPGFRLREPYITRAICLCVTHLDICEQKAREEGTPTSTGSASIPERTGHRNQPQQLHCPNCNSNPPSRRTECCTVRSLLALYLGLRQ